nr:MAG TPA: hypothetical protein [Crassvirales sp.]
MYDNKKGVYHYYLIYDTLSSSLSIYYQEK